MKEQNQKTFMSDMKESFNIGYMACDIVFLTLAPFLRYGQGKRAYSLRTYGSLILLMVCCRTPEFQQFLYAWVGMLGYRKLRYSRVEASYYQGWPVLFAWVRNEMTARTCEVLALVPIGLMLSQWSEPVGNYVNCATLAFSLKHMIARYYVQRRKDAWHDSRVEMELAQRQMQDGMN